LSILDIDSRISVGLRELFSELCLDCCNIRACLLWCDSRLQPPEDAVPRQIATLHKRRIDRDGRPDVDIRRRNAERLRHDANNRRLSTPQAQSSIHGVEGRSEAAVRIPFADDNRVRAAGAVLVCREAAAADRRDATDLEKSGRDERHRQFLW
jgi:hypothetical protein